MVHLGFDNTYARDLEGLYIPSSTRGFQAPEVMSLDDSLRIELGLPELTPAETAAIYSGTTKAEGAMPIAMAYAGHQFGGFSPQLGDGRAVLLGEVVDPQGHRWDLQLKGSGPTGFSRGGDGFAAVGPILREQLVSAAMHRLGVPTSRVLVSIRTGEQVRRESWLPGAMLVRVASSHLRVGTFQFFAARNAYGEVARLVDYAIARHTPEHAEAERPALALMQWVATQQAALIAAWLDVGFVHGVMNTDNFTISGETLDYGPCAFIDEYDPRAVFSSIDHHGRYAYGNQAGIAQWNLTRFGEALLPLIDDDQDTAVTLVKEVLAGYAEAFWTAHRARRHNKLGLVGEQDTDEALVEDLLEWMYTANRDYTGTFRDLAESLRRGESLSEDAAFLDWETRWKSRLNTEDPSNVADRMDSTNPLYIPRNHLVQQALDAAEAGDLEPFERLSKVLENPFERQDDAEAYAEPAPEGSPPCVTYCGT